MEPIEIIVIVLTSAFLIGMLARYLYRKSHNLPTGECAYCSSKGNRWLKRYRKKYPKSNIQDETAV